MSFAGPAPKAETVEALLDATWRLATAETARTDALDGKAATVATFASVLAVLTATLSIRFVEEFEAWWALSMFVAGLGAFIGSVLCAVLALMPRNDVSAAVSDVGRGP